MSRGGTSSPPAMLGDGAGMALVPSEPTRLDIVAAAERHHCSVKAVRRRIDNGSLPAVKVRVTGRDGRPVVKIMIEVKDLVPGRAWPRGSRAADRGSQCRSPAVLGVTTGSDRCCLAHGTSRMRGGSRTGPDNARSTTGDTLDRGRCCRACVARWASRSAVRRPRGANMSHRDAWTKLDIDALSTSETSELPSPWRTCWPLLSTAIE